MSSRKLEQFICFGTNAAAIERMMRMGQAIIMVIIGYPILTNGFIDLVHLGNQYVWTEPRVASHLVLTELRARVTLGRRFFRFFRFLESFHAAQTLYTSFYAPAPVLTAASSGGNGNPPIQIQKASSGSGIPAEAWLDIFAKTFNGMYLLLESSTTFDALGLDGFALWGKYWNQILHVEAQRFWFFALVCGVASGLVKLVKLFAHAPVPQTGEGYGMGEKNDSSEANGAGSEDIPDWKKDRDRMRQIVTSRKEARKEWLRNVRSNSRGLIRRICADFLDLAVPGVVVGWLDLAPGTLGLVMIVTTYLTGMEIWEKCGNQVAS